MSKGNDRSGAARAAASARRTTPASNENVLNAGLYAPRPIRTDTIDGQFLLALEIPECGCKLPRCPQCRHRYPCDCEYEGKLRHVLKGACEHIRAIDPATFPLRPEMWDAVLEQSGQGAGPHDTPADKVRLLWGELLRLYDPDGHDDPPPPPAPGRVYSRADGEALYGERADAGFRLFYPRAPGSLGRSGDYGIDGAPPEAILCGDGSIADEREQRAALDAARLRARLAAAPVLDLWFDDAATAADLLAAWRRDDAARAATAERRAA